MAVCLLFGQCSKDEISPLSIIHQGIVKDAKSEVPLGGATVKILLGESEKTATTNENGFYKFDPVPTGAYTLVFEKEGYLASEESSAMYTGPANSVTEQYVGNIDKSLSPLSEKVSLTIFKQKSPQLRAFAAANVAFTYKMDSWGDSPLMEGKTDEKGLLEVDGLPYGSTPEFYFDFTDNGIRYKGLVRIYPGSGDNSATIYMHQEGGSLGLVSTNIIDNSGKMREDVPAGQDLTFVFTLPIDTANASIGFDPAHTVQWSENNHKLTLSPTDALVTGNYILQLTLDNTVNNSFYNEMFFFGVKADE